MKLILNRFLLLLLLLLLFLLLLPLLLLLSVCWVTRVPTTGFSIIIILSASSIEIKVSVPDEIDSLSSYLSFCLSPLVERASPDGKPCPSELVIYFAGFTYSYVLCL